MDRTIVIREKTTKRAAALRLEYKENLDEEEKQVALVNQLYLGCPVAGDAELAGEIRGKIGGYRSQDKRKSLFSASDFVTYEKVLEKLVLSKLRCHYCKACMLLLYSDRRDARQWTLDRIDNAVGHSSSNTVIACLGCNLQRRCTDDKKFLFTKRMRIIKKN